MQVALRKIPCASCWAQLLGENCSTQVLCARVSVQAPCVSCSGEASCASCAAQKLCARCSAQGAQRSMLRASVSTHMSLRALFVQVACSKFLRPSCSAQILLRKVLCANSARKMFCASCLARFRCATCPAQATLRNMPHVVRNNLRYI